MADNTFNFRPSARLQQFLGRELIADPNVAIIEFVKNAYDADAKNVLVEFKLDDDPKSLLIADDGEGMNATDFEKNWMHPGFSRKAIVSKKQAEDTEADANKREPTGEKGIGRLAAGRLGNRLDVWSRKGPTAKWLHVAFPWSDFEDMRKHLDEIAIAYDFDTEPPNGHFETGTVILITDLTQRWDDMIRGRVVRGRSRTRLGRLRQDLEFLVRPMAPTGGDFAVQLKSDRIRESSDVGTISPRSALESADYRFEFSFSLNKSGETVIERTIKRSPAAAEFTGKKKTERLPKTVVTTSVAKDEHRPESLSSGTFKGEFLYNPPPAAQRAREVDESPVGVLIYRDNVLVEPYGIGENDWLGARARKAQRQGQASIQPDTFTGFVLIDRLKNEALRDQSNRAGLLQNAASEDFLGHMRAEFSFFEEIILKEVIEERWKANAPRKAGERAGEAQARARVQMRSLAHSIRQPLTGIEFEIATLKQLEKRKDLPEDARKTISEARVGLEEFVATASGLIKKFLDYQAEAPQFESVPLKNLVGDAVKANAILSKRRGVKIRNRADLEGTCLVPGEFVVAALSDLICNAIEAPRPSGTDPEVTLRAEPITRGMAIEVIDNGSGIADFNAQIVFSTIESTKGRPAVGLKNAELAVVAARGRIRVSKSDNDGTTIRVELPTQKWGLGQGEDV